MTRHSDMTMGSLLTAASALCFSALPLFGLAAYTGGANVTTLLGVRFASAATLIWAYVFWKRLPLPDSKTTWQLLGLGAIGYSSMSWLYLSSVEGQRLSPALAALLLYTYPGIVAIMAWAFHKTSLGRRGFIALLASWTGVTLVLFAPDQTMLFTKEGALMALGSAIVYSTYIMVGHGIRGKSSALVTTALVTSAAAICFMLYGILTGSFVSVSTNGWLAMLGAGLVSTVMAVGFFFAGMERLGPSRASLISTLEPVGTVALSALVLHQDLSLLHAAGGALVLGGVVLLQTRK